MSTKEVVRGSVFGGLADPQMSIGGRLTRQEKKAAVRTLELYRASTLAIHGKEAKQHVAAECTGRMYKLTSDVYTETTGHMIRHIDSPVNKLHAEFVNGFIQDQCMELQSDLKGMLQVAVHGVAEEVDRPLYEEPKKRGIFG